MASFRIYKPNKNNTGSVTQWEISLKDIERGGRKLKQWMSFLSMAQQSGVDDNGNARFDWDNQVIVKLEEVDIGEILAVLRGIKPSVGAKGSLFHQSPSGENKVIKFNTNENEGYYINISSQDSNKNVVKGGHTITEGEGQILVVFLTKALDKMLDGAFM